jgi:hypothetical protein
MQQYRPGTSDSGIHVPPELKAPAINQHHQFTWRGLIAGKPSILKSEVRVVAADRSDLFPPAPLWQRLDLPGGLVLFVREPVV